MRTMRFRRICVYCDGPAEGKYSIHRDGFCEGPQVPLCNFCGGDPSPRESEIWDRIQAVRRNGRVLACETTDRKYIEQRKLAGKRRKPK